MRHVTFYRLAALLPLVVPALVAIPSLVTGRRLFTASNVFGAARAYLVGSLLIGALPYVVLAAVALVLLSRRSQRAYSAAAWIAPLLFAPWLAICWLGFVMAMTPSGQTQPSGLAGVALALGGLALVVGYGYVVVVEALRILLVRLGLVQQ